MTATRNDIDFILTLQSVIRERKMQGGSESYTARLFAEGTKRIAQKVGEEGVEVALAAVDGTRKELCSESADLLYHLLVLLVEKDLSIEEICSELEARHS